MPVAYPMPQPGSNDVNKQAAAVTTQNTSTTNEVSIQTSSSTEHIQNVISEAGLSNTYPHKQTNNTWTQRALNAYTQNDKLAAQLRISESISGIDLYA
jgi:hypothetical protein